jgi:hypothetical protein
MSDEEKLSTLDKLIQLLRWQAHYVVMSGEYADFYNECADEIERLQERVKFLEQHTDIVVDTLLKKIDEENVPKFEAAKRQIEELKK